MAVGVRVNSSNGLIFYVTGESGRAGMTLSMSEGKLMLQFNGGKKKNSIMTNNKYDDGLWHTVSVFYYL